MEIYKKNQSTYQIKISSNDLKKYGSNNDDFMANSEKQNEIINILKEIIKKKYNVFIPLEEKYTFFQNNTFIITFKTNKKQFTFQSQKDFDKFYEFVKTTKYSEEININKETNEILLSSNLPPQFFSLMQEFTM